MKKFFKFESWIVNSADGLSDRATAESKSASAIVKTVCGIAFLVLVSLAVHNFMVGAEVH